jgi:hypothetical protein
MTNENDDFFIQDSEATDAAKRLHASLNGTSPAVLVSSNAKMKTFRLTRSQLKDAILCSTLRGADSRPDELIFGLGNNVIDLHSSLKGVQVWVRTIRAECKELTDLPLYFNLVNVTARRLTIDSIGTIDAQILLGGNDDDELRLKLGTARLRLSATDARQAYAAPAAVGPEGVEPIYVDAKELQTALRNVLAVAASTKSKIVCADRGRVYGDAQAAVVVSTHPTFAKLNFQIAEGDCQILSRILGRMQAGRTTFVASAEYYEFRDDLMLCRVRRAHATSVPLEQILSAEAEISFSPIVSDLLKSSTIATMTRPKLISLNWQNQTQSLSGSMTKLELHAYSPGRVDNCRASIPGRTDKNCICDSAKVTLEAPSWFAAIGLFDVDARIQLQTLKGSRILKLTGAKGDAQTSVFLAAVRS